MSSFMIALVFGVGVGTWVWSQLARSSGNARPTQTIGAAAAVGLIAFLVLFSVLKGILNLT